jgi:hypothetical protein
VRSTKGPFDKQPDFFAQRRDGIGVKSKKEVCHKLLQTIWEYGIAPPGLSIARGRVSPVGERRLELRVRRRAWEGCHQEPNSASVPAEAEKCKRASEGPGLVEGFAGCPVIGVDPASITDSYGNVRDISPKQDPGINSQPALPPWCQSVCAGSSGTNVNRYGSVRQLAK